MKVICNRVNDRCEWCEHSTPHDPDEVSDGKPDLHKCTEWGVCILEHPFEKRNVQCIEVQDEKNS